MLEIYELCIYSTVLSKVQIINVQTLLSIFH